MMLRGVRWLRLVTTGLAAGGALGISADPGFMMSAWDGLVQQGFGVNVTFRLVPALAGGLVVASAGSVFHTGRYGTVVALLNGRWQVWKRFWIDVTIGTSILTLSAFVGTYMGGGMASGKWTGLLLNTELAQLPWAPQVTVVVLALWNTIVTCLLVTVTASLGMVFRNRIAAATLPAVIGLTISIVSELRIGPLLDWRDKAGIFGPATTTWSQGILTIIALTVTALIIVRQIAIHQKWPRLWT